MHRRPAVLLALLALLFLPGSASAQDSLTLKALARIEQYERLEPGLEEGDAKTAALYLNQIAWAKKRLDAVSDQSEATWQDANRRYLALREKIEKKARGNAPPVTGDYDYAKLVQLNKEIANALSNFQLLSPKHLLDASRVRGIERDFLDFDSRLAEFPAEDENVKIVAGNLAGFHRLFDASMEKVRAGRDAKGGMDAKLEELRAKYESKNTPGNLVPPFEEQQLRAWALEMKRWREREIPADLAFLSEAANNPAVNQQAVNSLYHWLSGTWKRRLDEVEKQVRERVASDVQIGQEVAQFILDTDPANRSHVLRILSKGRFDENMQRLQDARHAVAMARVYDDAMGSPAVFGPTITDPSAPRPPKPDREAQAQLVERAIVHLEAVVEQALSEVRMPPPASTDAALLEVAEATLRNPSYGIQGWDRIVINAPKHSHVRREAWIQPGSVNATISYYEYRWDQFQVTTAEKVDGKYWLFANTLKNYSSGDPTTPVGRWILSRRFELTPILEENLDE